MSEESRPEGQGRAATDAAGTADKAEDNPRHRLSPSLAERVAEVLRKREQQRVDRAEFGELRRHGVAARHARKLRRQGGGHRG